MSWRPLFLGIAALLLCCAVLAAPVAAATEKQITELPYSDEGTTETYGYYENTFYYTGSSSYAHSNLALTLSQVQNFPHIYYATLEISSDYSPAPEGYSDAWYIRPSDGTYQKCVVQIVKTRNVLNQVTKTLISFYPTNWEVGSVTGAYTTSIYYDNNGVPSATGFLDVQGTKSIYGITKADGNDDYEGRLYFAGRINYASSMRSHVEGYGSTYYKLDVSKTYSSVTIALTRTKDGVSYPSSLDISDSSGSVIISDSTSVDKSFTIAESRFSSASVSIGEDITKYLYNTGGSTEPAESEYFSLSISPENGIGSPITATLTAADGAPAYDYINWQFNDPGSPYETTFEKNTTSGIWYQYDEETELFDIEASESDYLTPQFTPTKAGYTYIACQVYSLADKKKLADLIQYVTISDIIQSDQFPVDIQVFDADTGGGLLRVNLDVKNLQTGEIDSYLIQTNSVGYRLMLQVGNTYDLTLSKSGYESRTFSRVGSTTKTLTARLPKSVSSDPDKVWVYFYVLDGSQTPISGAAVQLSGLSTTLTNSQGLAKIEVSTNTTYQYTVSKADYTGVSDEIIIESASQWKYVTLTPTGAAVTSPVPTGPGTVTTPDTRTIDEKATSALSLLFDNVELFAALAGLILVTNMLTWILPGGRR